MIIDGIKWKKDPLAHQVRIVNGSTKVLQQHGYCAFFCEVGTRKTSMSITAAMALYDKGLIDSIVIICPNTLFSGWVDEFSLHADLPNKITRWDTINHKTIKGKKELSDCLSLKLPVFIINYDAFSRDSETVAEIMAAFKKRKTLCIMDESHKIKSPASTRTGTVITYANFFKFRIIMTGTEIPAGISNIWSQFEALKKGFWKNYGIGNYTCFRARFEIMKLVKFPNGVAKEVPLQEKFMKDYERDRYHHGLTEINKFIDPFTFRARRIDCYDLPDMEVHYLEFTMSEKEQKVYSDMKRDLFTKLENNDLLAITNPATLFIRFRQITRGYIGETIEDEYGKTKQTHVINETPSALTALLEHVEGHDENAIISCAFTFDVEIVAKALASYGSVVTMYGGNTQEANQAAKMKFEKGEVRFIVGNDRMLSSGHNFQYHCAMLYMYSPGTDNEAWGQLPGRINRSGQKNKMQFFRLIAKQSIDKRIYDILEGNLSNQYNFANISIKQLMELA